MVVSLLGVDTIEVVTFAYASPNVDAAVVQPIAKAVSTAAKSSPSPQTSGQPVSSTPGAPNTGETTVASAVYTSLKSLDFAGLVHPWNPITNWHAHWAGMLITLFALSLGAPFWFDALSTFVNVRQAGQKPTT